MANAQRAGSRRDNSASVLIGAQNGEYLELGGFEHIALLARTGTGKTSSFAIPNAFNWEGSLVILDIKGETYRATAGYRANVLGQDVYCFNPTAHDLRTHCWNPLSVIDRDSHRRFDQISRQAHLMIPAPPASHTGNVEFWKNISRLALSSVLWLLAETPDEELTYENVLMKFLRADGLQWLTHIIQNRRITRNPFSERVVAGVSNYIGKAERLTEDVRVSVVSELDIFINNPQVAAATARSDFDLRDLRRKPMTIYVTISPADIPRVARLLRLLFGSIVNLNTDLTSEQDPSIQVPLLVILDEFARLGAVHDLTSAAQFARGYGLRMAYVVQDKPQLQELYGHAGAADVFNNVGAEIIFGLGDVRQAKEYEERLGNQTRAYDTGNSTRFWRWINWKRMTLTQHLIARPLMWAFEITQMPEDEALILRPNMKPMKVNRKPYYKEPYFMNLISDPPVPPLLDVQIKPDDGTIALPFIETTPNHDLNARPPWMLAKLDPNQVPANPHDDTPPPNRRNAAPRLPWLVEND